MNGIQKIIDKILADARSYAERITTEAEKNAGDIIADAEAEAMKMKKNSRLNTEKEAENMIGRVRSSINLAERNRLLHEKSILIDRAFEMAKANIINLDQDAYCAFLSSLMSKAVDAPNEKYTIMVNQRDRESIKRVISDSAFDITLSPSDADIEGGLILKRGDIETNCSLEILIAGLRETLESEIFRVLFD